MVPLPTNRLDESMADSGAGQPYSESSAHQVRDGKNACCPCREQLWALTWDKAKILYQAEAGGWPTSCTTSPLGRTFNNMSLSVIGTDCASTFVGGI